MRGIGLVFRQQVIQAMLWIFRQRVRQFNSQTAESWRSNRYPQSGGRLSSCAQICDAFVNQISAG